MELNKRRAKVRLKTNNKYNNLFILGQYENPEWFNDIRGLLIDEFTPRLPKREKNNMLYSVIENRNSVCVSIRRGDFLQQGNEAIFNVCTVEYFKNGIKQIKNMIDKPVFVMFSDDIEWVKSIQHEIFSDEEVYYETGDDPVWEKLRLMYSCKHFIISNSTFSWWAQYLSRNESDKIVVAPSKWRKTCNYWPLLEDSFIQIKP